MIKRIEIYQSAARATKGQFGWRVTGRNNRILAVAGELFKNRRSAEQTIERLFLLHFSPVADFYGRWIDDTSSDTLQVVDLTGKGGRP